MRWLLAICIFTLSGCYVTTVRWPQPYLLPRKIHGISTIGKKVGVFQIKNRNFPVSQGTIYRNNGQQLTGNTWIRPYTTYGKGHHILYEAMVEQVTLPWSAIDKRNIYDPAIFRKFQANHTDSVKMQLPLPYHLGDTTTYVNFPHTVFLRRDLIKGPIAIYDMNEMDNHELSRYTDRFISPRLILLTNGKDTVRAYHGSFFGETSMKRKLIKFIHRRYQVDKQMADFKDAGDILNFIAEEEYKRNTDQATK